MSNIGISLADCALPDAFTLPILQSSALLHPIRTWEAMFREMQVTGVDFDAFWYERVSEGEACFFSWSAGPRATVLVVLDDNGILHIECRGEGDRPLSAESAAPIVLEVWRVLGHTGDVGGPGTVAH